MPRNELFSYRDGIYRTTPTQGAWFSRMFPTARFYRKFVSDVIRSSAMARRGEYGDDEWCQSSRDVMTTLESVGVEMELEGVENIRRLDSPCVFIGNHMSMLETIVLPSIIQPICPVTFVLKKSLLEYPVFRHIASSRNPIGVARDNPREDFATVMKEGVERLGNGISIIVFPQTTRSSTFEPEHFNSIGVKLASRAQVPVMPIALITDAWGNGKWLKDLGPIDPSKKVRIAFGEPLVIQGRGSSEQQKVIEFIENKLSQWRGGTQSSLDCP